MSEIQQKNYWVQVFNETTWREFIKAGGTVTGFRDSRWGHVQKLRKGDVLLCYLRGQSKWIGILEVLSEPLTKAISIHNFHDELSIFQMAQWSLYVMPSPAKWTHAAEANAKNQVRPFTKGELTSLLRSLEQERKRIAGVGGADGSQLRGP
jgi:hypothetical protein